MMSQTDDLQIDHRSIECMKGGCHTRTQAAKAPATFVSGSSHMSFLE